MLRRRTLAATIPLVLILCAVLIGFWQRQSIMDYVRLYDYTAPEPIHQLADNTTLTDGSRRVFYVNHPVLQDRNSFKSSCKHLGEHTIVLGCYHPVDRGIYIFHVTDERLSGVDQVTAAHELLHAEYDRLSTAQRTHINNLLENYYKNALTDTRIKNVIASYQKTEPNDVPNEMHSVFGTEVADLPPELETYYRQYFVNRQKVVMYANDYQAEFNSRQAQVKNYDDQLTVLKSSIAAHSDDLGVKQKAITTRREELDRMRQTGNISDYNAGVSGYNQQIDDYNRLLTTTRSEIDEYNQTVSQRNDIALQVTELAQSIDSSFQPI